MTATLLLTGLALAACGLAVGATSIGGVLVVPALTAWGGVSAERAVAAASFAFAFTGLAAWWQRRRPGPGPAAAAAPIGGRLLAVGAFAGAVLGAATLALMPVAGVQLAVGLIAMVSGLHTWWATTVGDAATRREALAAPAVLVLGLGVGCLSAWSGTGGPVVLLPLLAVLGLPALRSVDAAQQVQLPVALAASVVHAVAGRLDLGLGAAVGVLVLAGWFVGRAVARRLPVRRLQQAVATALIATGAWYL